MRCVYLKGCWAVPLLLACSAWVGCGGGDSGGGETYAQVLNGLKKAAVAHERYDAMERAQDLDPAHRASLRAFCEVNREMLINEEAWKVEQGGYYISRIRLRAERELPFVSTGPVNFAVGKYVDLFKLRSFDPMAVRRYDEACYRAKLWY